MVSIYHIYERLENIALDFERLSLISRDLGLSKKKEQRMRFGGDKSRIRRGLREGLGLPTGS